MNLTCWTRQLRTRRAAVVGLAVAMAVAGGWWATTSRAQSAGQSFTALAPGFTQELFGVTGDLDPNEPLAILGGVAFAPDADVWSSECVFLGTRLHRFDRHAGTTVNATPLHPETVVDLTSTAYGPAGGCGLVNHPDGSLYSNSATGVWKLNAETGQPVGPPIGPGGNALGIALDPQSGDHLIYVGDDCHPTLTPDSLTCTFWDLDPATGVATVFARLARNSEAFVDGIYFDPSGALLFGAYREYDGSTGTEHHSLLVLQRPAAPLPVTAPADNSQIVRQVPMVAEPDGVAFHAATGAVVTLNESPDCLAADGTTLVPPVSEVLYDEFGDPYATVKSCPGGSTAIGGTMSVFNFPGGDYTAAPTHGLFARGGFRGDLTQVGADGCIYATQGALFQASQSTGARYNDGTETNENSIVRICGGFVPPVGVTGSVTAQVFTELTCNGTRDADDALGGVEVTLTGPTGTVVTGTTDASGAATFEGLIPGTYTVSIANAYVGENAPPAVTSVDVVVTTGQTTAATFDFIPLGTLGGRLFDDADGNGLFDLGEPGLPGVTVTVTGTASDGTPVNTSAITDAAGTYTVTGLRAGTYTVTAPTTVGGATTTTPTTVVTLVPCQDATVDVPYLPAVAATGDLSGTVFVDTNRNGVRDGGEPGIPGVTVTLGGAESATTTSAGDGSYSFTDLDAGSYMASAPGMAAGKALFTPSPLSVSLAAGESSPNHDFGYVTGALSGTVFTDTNRNGVRDGGEPGIGGVTVTLGGAGTATTTSAGDGSYSFANLDAGSYTASAPATAAGKALFTPSPLSVDLAAGASSPNHDFGYVTGALSGTVFTDTNRNGVRDGGEPGIGGVTVTLGGAGTATTTSAGDGSYSFANLDAGSYTASAPATAAGKALFTPSPLTVDLAAGASSPNHDFGYVTGALSGTVFTDTNRNGVRDGGEPGIGGVTVTLGGAGTATTTSAGDGSYSFTDLDAGSYTASAPATAVGKALFTPSPLSVTLAAGASSPNHDFGYVTGALSGTVFTDTNRNGVRDGGEPGIGGVTVTLGGAGSATTTSAGDGSYSFTDLDAGSYTASAPATAVGKALFTPSPLSVTLAAGASSPNHDFGYVTGALSGTVFTDTNRNGARDGGEPGIGGVTVTLGGAGSATTTSAGDGSYSFTDLDAGSYTASAPATAVGKALFTPSPLSVSLAAGVSSSNHDFGYVTGALSGTVFTDTNRNGVRDGGEPGIGGVTVTLGGAGTATTTSAGDGSYSFTDLDAGSYTASAPATAVGKALFTPSPLSVSLAAGVSSSNHDFGYVQGGLSGFAYLDANHNGSKDGGEAGIGGVVITLGSGGTVTTVADGSYAFSNLDAATYSVAAPTGAAGYDLSTPSPLSVPLAAGQMQPNINFGYTEETILQNPGLSLIKTANPTMYSAAGQVIVYTYQLQNTGDVTLAGPFTITDNKLGTFQCGAATSLAPGALLSCTRNYTIQASDLGTVPSLPTGVVANVSTGAWLQGQISTQDTTITNAGPGIPDGVYAGWCIQDHVIIDLHNEPGTLYSSIGGNLPADLAGLPWGKVNYVLNHKIRGVGKSDLEFFKDVQTAVWVSVGEPNPEFGISAEAQQMITAANANANYVPGAGDVVAAIIYSDGMGTNPYSIQESIIELKPYQTITNTATASGAFGGASVQSAQVQAVVTQVQPPTPQVSTAPMDTIAWGHRSSANTSVTTSTFSTTAPNELLLAFVSADATASGTNNSVTGISGAGLTWQLVARANAQRGTAEIWRAFTPTVLSNVSVTATLLQAAASSLTVVSMVGVETSGTNGSGAIGATATAGASSGAPAVTLTTTRSNSWIFGVGTDWDNPIARTVGPNQEVVHQYMPPVGDTYWVQRLIDAIPAGGTAATLNDIAPTSDRWNFAAVEIVAAGQPVIVPNVVNLTQAAATSSLVASGLTTGGISSASSATVPSGSVIGQAPSAGAQVDAGTAVALVVSSGPAPVTVPNTVNMTQAEASAALTTAGLTTGSVTTASSATVPSGKVLSQNPAAGAQVPGGSLVALVVSSGPPVTVPNTVNMTQAAATTTINAAGLTLGTVTTASSATVPSGTVISQNPAGGAQVAAGSAVAIVVSTGPAVSAPVVDKVVYSDGRNKRTTPAFSTTGPNRILIAFAASDGPTSGNQTLTVSGAGLTWTLVRRANTRLGTSEIWKATATSTLTNVKVSSTQSKTGYDQSLTVVAFSGATGVGASATAGAASGAPSVSVTTTKANSLVYGVGNDWDRAAARTLGANQSMVHQWVDTSVGDTFWVQSRSAPIATAGTVVQINDTAPTNDQWNLAAVEIVP